MRGPAMGVQRRGSGNPLRERCLGPPRQKIADP